MKADEKEVNCGYIVTVIVPTYNASRFINTCLDSIFRQIGVCFQVVIVDDASTDDTVHRIETDYCQELQNGRLRILCQEVNAGPADSRSLGLQSVQTPYVTFVDSDDFYTESFVLSEMVRKMEDTGADLCVVKFVNMHGRLKVKRRYRMPHLQSAKDAMLLKLKRDDIIWHSVVNKCYRMSVIQSSDVRFLKGGRTAEDVLFNEAYLVASKNVCFIDKYFYCYNCNNDVSITRGKGKCTSPSRDSLSSQFEYLVEHSEKLLLDARSLECEENARKYILRKLMGGVMRLRSLAKTNGIDYDPLDDLSRLNVKTLPWHSGDVFRAEFVFAFAEIVRSFKGIVRKSVRFLAG